MQHFFLNTLNIGSVLSTLMIEVSITACVEGTSRILFVLQRPLHAQIVILSVKNIRHICDVPLADLHFFVYIVDSFKNIFMKSFPLLLILLAIPVLSFTQNLGIGTNTPDPSAKLDIVSTSSGFLPPRMTAAQRDAISNPAAGLLIYNTTSRSIEFYNGTSWAALSGSQPGGGTNYTFSSPQFIDAYRPKINSRANFTMQKKAISSKFVFEDNTSRSTGGSPYFIFVRRNLATGSSANLEYNNLGYHLFCFAINNTQDFVYAVIDSSLFKLSMNEGSFTTIASNIGYCRFIKVLANNDLVVSSGIQNGSLIKFSNDNPTFQTIASNLDAPPYAFDVLNNEYYAVFDFVTGSFVKKITANGTVTNVLTNLPQSFGLVFDSNGNFVLGNQFTSAGNLYMKYSMYKPDGTRIQDITDDAGKLIAGYPENYDHGFVPLYIDAFNNLFFDHIDGNAALSNPYANNTLNGLYKLELKK